MPRYLIVNADDFGHTMGVSGGILRAHREGVVTSTSVMINKPAAAESIGMAQREAPDLGLGLHLTLTSGKPVLAAKTIPDLVQADGSFYRPGALEALLAEIDMSQVERELRTQVDHFVRLAGSAPDHLDSHHHITYSSPGIARVMLRLAAELDVPVRNAFPNRVDAQHGASVDGDREASQDDSAWHDLLATSPVRMPDYFLDAFYDDRVTLGDLLNMVADVPEGVSELMCHPAVVDEALQAASSYADRRGDELAALIHPSVRELSAAGGIELISFRWLSEKGVSR